MLVNDLATQPAGPHCPVVAPHRGFRSNGRQVEDEEAGYAGDDDEDRDMARQLRAEIDEQQKIDEPYLKAITVCTS